MGKIGPAPGYLVLVVLLVAVKVGWLLADPTAMLFLGDSDSYIATAVDGLIPLDRSFVYGFFVRVFAVWPHSLTTLVVFQSLCSVFAGLIFAWALRSSFQVPWWIAYLSALAWTLLEPITLLYERYVMAEAVALPFFALFIAFGLRYVDTRNLRWLFAVHAAGVATLSLRYSFVPVAWAAAVLLPAIAFAARSDGQVGSARVSTRMRFLAHLGFSVAAMLLMHQAYKTTHGRLQQFDPAYNYAEGMFLVSAVAPVLAPEDFDDPALGRLVTDLRGVGGGKHRPAQSKIADFASIKDGLPDVCVTES